ncbi:MAG: PilZ domain-containing protein [Acidobacteria bacterium]|nr:PilZ domain-containing protein [Acidobacteriota bacterium]
MTDTADKRSAQRFAITLPGTLILNELRGDEITFKTRDISSSGVYLEFGTPVSVGSSLQFVLTFPPEITNGNPLRVECKGNVIRVEKHGADGTVIGAAATIERYQILRQ